MFPKKSSNSIDFMGAPFKRDPNILSPLFKENGFQSVQNINRKKIELDEEEDSFSFAAHLKPQVQSSRKESLPNFLNEERNNNSEKKGLNMPYFLNKPGPFPLNKQASNAQKADKKHSISFYEQSNEKADENLLGRYLFKKHERLENIIEEKEKKEKSNENSIKKMVMEKENFTLRLENRTLKKSNEELKKEVEKLRSKVEMIDLLSDRDRTVGENLDLKKTLEDRENEISGLKENNERLIKQIVDLKESNSVVSQANFSIEEKMKKQITALENSFQSKIKSLLDENKELRSRIVNKERDIQELMESSKRGSAEFKTMLELHRSLAGSIDKFAKVYQNQA